MAAVAEAKAAGVFVVSASMELTHGFDFRGLERVPLADPETFASYRPGQFWASDSNNRRLPPDLLFVPMDFRTTASPGGAGEYAFYSRGGMSWAVPYVAGAYALAAQVDPALTPERFWALALQTGKAISVTRPGEKPIPAVIIDPVALVGALRR